jgi:glycosyltransferase involved in cell wall biosynthesis
MKIAMVASPWVPVPPPAYGGTETVLDTLVRGLAAAGHDVVFFGHPDSDVPAEPRATLPRHAIGPIGHTASELAHVITAYELATDVDVIHDHTIVGPLVGTTAPDMPIVVTNHGPFDLVTKPVMRAIARRAQLVAISQSQASTADDIPVAGVVHHGIDVDEWPLGDGGGDYFLFLGRMTADKGAHHAIKVARAAGVPLILAAKMRESAERAFFEAEVKPLLGRDAEYIGEVGGRDKCDLLAGARALLNPISWPEPFGMVMVESLACGTPVITSPVGAAPEIVDDGETGFLCCDDDDYVAALTNIDSIDRGACRKAVADRFTVERMVAGYLEQYQLGLDVRHALAS